MTLRRFPWKAPRVTDNSYKLFVSPPNDGPKSITPSSKSSTDPSEATGDHHRGSRSESSSRHPADQPQKDGAQSTEPSTSKDGDEKQQPTVIKGPWRLLRLLPRESRHIIGRMLEIDPNKRATLDEILEDKWVINSQVCSQEEGGKVMRVENHEHTLEPGAPTSSAPPTKPPQK